MRKRKFIDRTHRLLASVEVTDSGCWARPLGLDRYGYSRFGGRLAHRVAYELFAGEVPPGMELDHLCRLPRCVNPDHLDPVTHRENLRRSPNSWALDPSRASAAAALSHPRSH